VIDSAISAIFTFFTNIFKYALDGCLWLIGKVFYIMFDGVLTAITAIFTAIDLSSIIGTYAMSWAGVPTQMIWFINAVSIPAGITMICAAIGIRMMINLIPAAFTRI
jgi:hypothetical protein